MVIREATTADSDAVAPLIIACLAQHESWDTARYGLTGDVEKEYRRWFGRLAEDPRTTILIAEEDGRPVGYMVATVRRDRPIYRTGDYVVIHDLWVENPDGDAGRELLKNAAKRFAAAGVTQLRAATAAANNRVRTLLESTGFRVCQIDLLMELPAPKTRKKARKETSATAPIAGDAMPRSNI
jgi:L-amino acid N-acyltransferase YncA